MSSTTDKIKGAANQTLGKAKESLGHAIGNEQMEAEGVVQQVKGSAQKSLGAAKDKVKKIVDGA